MMRSKITAKILEETPERVREEVREYGRATIAQTYCNHHFVVKDQNWKGCIYCGLIKPASDD